MQHHDVGWCGTCRGEPWRWRPQVPLRAGKEVVFGLQCDRTGRDAERRACSFAPAITTTSRC